MEFVRKGSLVRTLPSYGRWSWFAFTPSCWPHHHVNHTSFPSSHSWEVHITLQKRVNSRVKTLSSAKPCIFWGNVAPGIAEVGSLFPRLRDSIWQSCRQKVHRSESSICISKCQKKKKDMFGALLGDEVGKMRTTHHQTVARELDLHFFKHSKKSGDRSTFGGMRLAKFIDSVLQEFIHWFLDLLIRWTIDSLLRWSTDSMNGWIAESLISWFSDSLLHGFIGSFNPWWIMDGSMIHWIVESLTHWFLDSVIHLLTDSLVHWFVELLTH